MKPILYILFFSLLTACGGGGGQSSTSRGQVNISERSDYNDDVAGAQFVNVNSNISGNLSYGVDMLDVFNFSLSEATALSIALSGPENTDFDISVADRDGTYMGGSASYTSTEEMELVLEAGSYYIAVETYEGSGDYILSIKAGNQSVHADAGSVCVQIDNLTQTVADTLVNNEYEYGRCNNDYAYRCDIPIEALEGSIFITSEYSYSQVKAMCDDSDGNLVTL